MFLFETFDWIALSVWIRPNAFFLFIFFDGFSNTKRTLSVSREFLFDLVFCSLRCGLQIKFLNFNRCRSRRSNSPSSTNWKFASWNVYWGVSWWSILKTLSERHFSALHHSLSYERYEKDWNCSCDTFCWKSRHRHHQMAALKLA